MISRRGLEAATATLTGAFGAAVAASSVQNGIGWSSAGVDAGTFPFMTGLIILGGSLVNFALGLRADSGVMLGRSELKKLAGLFLPAAGFVAAIPLIGGLITVPAARACDGDTGNDAGSTMSGGDAGQ